MRILPCGGEALLVEVSNLQEVEDLYGRLRRDTPPGVTDLVPAARTILVAFDPAATGSARLRALLQEATTGSEPTADPVITAAKVAPPTVIIPVRYDGPDLDDLARLTGLTPAQIIQRHLRGRHRVAFCGFAPGFAYISGLDPSLRVPRRDSPRTRVPAGAIAVADEFTGVYPRASPGGWHLIGRTDLTVFDLTRDPPALLMPGTAVRFVAVDAAGAVRS
ncbi:5-oxoprolinase subunit B family protein [Frankia tisae]|uniref:5-oxoprolinase subunit B family protein n=1 Tax=Frankia tisae TaxID=2950104 RepID=UPI0021BE778D|nr:allophanate hydrolase subunit 1 [Frankia tisae]